MKEGHGVKVVGMGEKPQPADLPGKTELHMKFDGSTAADEWGGKNRIGVCVTMETLWATKRTGAATGVSGTKRYPKRSSAGGVRLGTRNKKKRTAVITSQIRLGVKKKNGALSATASKMVRLPDEGP